MKDKKLFLGLSALCAVNFAAHLFFYPALPETVPSHWGFDGQINGWSPKWITLVLAALPFAMLLMMYFLPRIDPKAENYQKHLDVWKGFTIGITLFMGAISWLTELAVFDVLPSSGNLVSVLVGGGCGILFIVLGNYMPRVRQNYFFGCKTPWALADEHNWQRTQRMGGITFVVMGIAMLFSVLFSALLGEKGTVIVTLGSVFGGVGWIYLYSYLVFIKKMK